jgi:hypothetical protein
MNRWMVISIALGALAALGFSAAAVAAGHDKVVTDLSGPSVYTDDELCHFGTYDFDVQVSGYDKATQTDYYDADGNLTKSVIHDQFRGTVTANAVTLEKSEDATITEDWLVNTERWTGVAERYDAGHGKPIVIDRGDITFDENGVASEHGQHAIIDGPGNDAVCAALS